MLERALVSSWLSVLALWIGGSFCMSALVLPVLFLQMPSPSEAGAVAALLFPVYFRAGSVLSLIALVLTALVSQRKGKLGHVLVALVAVMAGTQIYQALLLQPEMATLRGRTEHVARFQALHRRSVRLNSVVLGGGLVLLAASGVLVLRRREPGA